MSYPLSDEESSDSDSGVRFKTTSVRDKFKSDSSSSFNSLEYSNDKYSTKNYRDRSPERSSHREKLYKHSRDYDRERRKERHSGRRHKRDDSRDIKCLEKRSDRKEDKKSSRENKNQMDRKSEEARYSKCSEKEKICKSHNKSQKDVLINNTNEDNFYGPTLLENISSINKRNMTGIDKIDESNEKDAYGPTLPPLKSENDSNSMSPSSKICKERNDEPEIYGPLLPKALTNIFSKVQPESNEDINCFGPSLPPNLNKKRNNVNESYKDHRIIGPSLPDHLIENKVKNNNENIVNKTTSNSDSDEDMNIIGPLPNNIMNRELEERALEIKLNSYSKNTDIKTREEWMLELPEVYSIAQTLGPRTFRTKEMPDMSDRSCWTEVNGQKINKPSTTKVDLNTKYVEEKNAIQEKIVEKHKKNKRCKSLIDMHREKMQIKKVKEKSNERRPFTRDIDLQVNRFDAEHSKAVIKKAHLLDSRFSSGQSKFL